MLLYWCFLSHMVPQCLKSYRLRKWMYIPSPLSQPSHCSHLLFLLGGQWYILSAQNQAWFLCLSMGVILSGKSGGAKCAHKMRHGIYSGISYFLCMQVTTLSSHVLNKTQIHAQVKTSLPINFIASQELVLFSTSSIILSLQHSQVDLTLFNFLLKTLFLIIWFKVIHKQVSVLKFPLEYAWF